jgi:DNA-directed RNA polymerase specialized sigma24 family protein
VSSVEREVLEMRYIDGLSWERISITECISRATVFRKVDQAYSILLGHQRVRELVEAWQSKQVSA